MSTNLELMRNKKIIQFIFSVFLSFVLVACSAAKKSEQDLVDELNNRMHQIDEQLVSEKVFSPLRVSKSAKEALKSKADSVIALVKELKEEYPENKELPTFLYQAGSLATMIDDNEQALEFYNTVVNDYPEFEELPEVLYLRGHEYRAAKNFEEAKESFNALMLQFPNHAYAIDAKNILKNADFENVEVEIESNLENVQEEMEDSNEEMDKELEDANEKMEEEMEKANDKMKELEEKMN